MGNGNVTADKKDKSDRSKTKQTNDIFHRHKTNENLIFYACTDKARVITEILEERGWTRTKDIDTTNFTLKWCLEYQVDWKTFREGKQLINNVPGQITFADKVNLWYTVRNYLNHRQELLGINMQTFLPMTFILDNENELVDFLRIYKKQSRTWIYKPRYSYAGQGIHVISSNSELENLLKPKLNGNRVQYQPKAPGYLMQEYISRPLLIKGRKFDIRVHWLMAWTKPLLVFYNHHASVIRLSLNLYREFDFDRATHLTNLSVQEHHSRYAYSHEATGMTMQQLNQHFNQCFRPFHPKMCQDWIITVLQERMQTIIRQVVRASKDKLERTAGHFGLFGCDFLLDENFRLWLLEINDNPGVGWGNTQLNTTTKPLFEETFDILLECFEKHKKGRPFLPMQCLKHYQLIYDENNDNESILHDDNQVFSERSPVRQLTREMSSRTSVNPTLPHIQPSRASTTNESVANSEIILPAVTEIKTFKDQLKTVENGSDINRLTQLRAVRAKYTFKLKPNLIERTDHFHVQRSLSSAHTTGHMQRKKRIDLKPIILDRKRKKQQHHHIRSNTIETDQKENTMIVEEIENEHKTQTDVSESSHTQLPDHLSAI